MSYLDEERAEGGMAEADVPRTRAEGPQEILLRRNLDGRRGEGRAVRLQHAVAVAAIVFAGNRGGRAKVQTLEC